MPGRLVPLNARGKLPSSVLPNRSTPGGYTHTVIVSPEPNPIEAGRVLREVVGGIADPSASNPYLVKIEPGIYDLDKNSLFMRPFVDIEGSGEGITTITSSLGTGSGTVVGANNSELRFLTVKNTGEAGQLVVALFSESTSPRYDHVTAMASGGNDNEAIHISNGSPVLRYVTARASGGSRSTRRREPRRAPDRVELDVQRHRCRQYESRRPVDVRRHGPGYELHDQCLGRRHRRRPANEQRDSYALERDVFRNWRDGELRHLQRLEGCGSVRERAPVPHLGRDVQHLLDRRNDPGRGLPALRPGGDVEPRFRALRRFVRCDVQPAFAGLRGQRCRF